MIGTDEPFATLRAAVSLFSAVGAFMTKQLIRSSKTGLAEEPIADKGLISRVTSQMCPKMRSLAVYLIAPGDVTDVDFSSVGTGLISLLAIGPSAGNTTLLLNLPIQRGESRSQCRIGGSR